MGAQIMLHIINCFFIAAFSAAFGSFMGVVIARVPRGESIISPGSHCDTCGHRLSWKDLIPIFSYLHLKGKCRYCGTKIGPQAIYLELAAIFGSWAVYWGLGGELTWTFAIFWAAWIISLGIIGIDWTEYFIPDGLIIALLVIGIASIWLGTINRSGITVTVSDRLLGFASAFCLWFIFFVLKRILGHAVIGDGDLKLIAVWGLLMGWKLLIVGVVVGCIYAIAIEFIFKKKLKRDIVGRSIAIPFGPYLTAGFFTALFFGCQFIAWYMTLFA